MSGKIILEPAKHATAEPESFPTDTALPALSLLGRPAEFVGLLSSLLVEWMCADKRISDCRVNLRRYVPGKRCIVALELSIESKESGGVECRKLIGKVYANGQGNKVYDTLQELRNHGFADGPLTVSQPLAYDANWQLLLLHHSEGQLLKNLILTQSNLEWAMEGAAKWLAKLHRCGVSCGRRYSLHDQLRTLGAQKRALEGLSPEAARRFGDILARIESRSSDLTEPRTSGPTHRDFSPDHLLVDGAHFTGLDFDEFCQYDSLFDVAHFMAHLRFLSLLHFGMLTHFDRLAEVFLAAYLAGARDYSAEQMNLYQTIAYFKLAHIAAVVRRPPAWQDIVAALLAEVQQFG